LFSFSFELVNQPQLILNMVWRLMSVNAVHAACHWCRKAVGPASVDNTQTSLEQRVADLEQRLVQVCWHECLSDPPSSQRLSLVVTLVVGLVLIEFF